MRSTEPKLLPDVMTEEEMAFSTVHDWPFSLAMPHLLEEIKAYCAVRLSVNWVESWNRFTLNG